MTGPSIGWKLRENREVISDLSDRRLVLGGVGFHQLMKLKVGKTSKNRQFSARFKSVSKLILHKPATVVDCNRRRPGIFTVPGLIFTKKNVV